MMFASFLRQRRSRARLAALAGIILVGLTSCGEKAPASGGSAKGGRSGGGPAPVIVGKAQRKPVPLVIDAIGAIEPIKTAAIRSQVTGTLLRIAFAEGQDVKEGDLLFEIDPRPFRNALQSAEADLQKTRVQLENARGQVERYRSLSADAMVSKEQFQKIQDDARALEAQLLADESAVSTAKLQLSYCSIRAPIAGRTGNLGVHEGDLVRANENTAVLVTINQLSPIYVTFGVPQQHLAALARYRASGALPVLVVPPGSDEQPEHGELTFVDNTVDPSTGTIRLKATLPNPKERLWPGQFANVTVTLATPEVLTVAASAVQTSQAGQHVFIVGPDNIAELRPIVVERTLGMDAVVAKGLAEGETVIVDGQLRVIPGRSVEIKLPGGAGSPSSREKNAGSAAAKAKKKET